MARDPYEVLGVPRTATDDEIKQAYRRLAKKYHPDLNPGDESAAKKMNEVNEAYDRIRNPQNYRSQQTQSGPYSYGTYTYGTHQQGNSYEDPFEEIFRQFRQQAEQQQYQQYQQQRQYRSQPRFSLFSIIKTIILLNILINLVSCMARPLFYGHSFDRYYDTYKQEQYAQSGDPAYTDTWR